MIRDQRVKALWKAGFEKKRDPQRVTFLIFGGFFILSQRVWVGFALAFGLLCAYAVSPCFSF